MESLAGKDNPQGILAVVHQKQAQFSDLKLKELAVAIVSPQDPGNVGTILRTLDAVGADAFSFSALDGSVWSFIIRPLSVPAWERFSGSQSSKLRLMNLFGGREKVVIN